MAVNNDDDDENGKMDKYDGGTQPAEDDLVAIQVSISSPRTNDTVKLWLTAQDKGYIKFWTDRDKQNEVVLTEDEHGLWYKEYTSGWSVTDTLYVEGMTASPDSGNRHPCVTLTYIDGYGDGVARDPPAEIRFTVVHLDMDMDGVKDDENTYCDVTEEITPGGFVALNDDDDNDNGTPDKDESGPVTGEDDLVKITLHEPLPTLESLIPIDDLRPVVLKVVAGGSKIKVWDNEQKQGTPIALPKYYVNRSQLPDDLWVEGVQVSSSLRDVTLALEYTIGGHTFEDKIKVTIFDVDLLVNNTSLETDDYVVLLKSGDIRDISKNWPAGAPDNHIPMKVHLEGPSGFSCKVKLSDSGLGSIVILKTDGSVYPAEGETVTVGTDLLVRIFGESPSINLDDVTITAKTDKTGNSSCDQEDLTVIWIYSFDMGFRGSGHQGQALTACSTAKFTNFQAWRQDKVGKFIYHKPTGANFDVASYQMELNIATKPNKVISDVEWDIKREISRAAWGPGSGTLTPIYKGETDWADDDATNNDEDRTQSPNCKKIFVIDGPGYGDSLSGLPYSAGYRFSYKGKFREWVEVKIGGHWFVCSPYKEWRSIMHVKFEDPATGWIEDASKTNEIVPGTISGFAGSWSEN